jgi:DNA-directed RNA polymerase specialized sigma24 family protein
MLVDELREIRFRANEISGIQERIARLQSIAEKVTPSPAEGSRGTSTQDRMADTVAKAVDLMDVLKLRVVEFESRIQAVEAEVDRLPPNFRAVIKFRDFKGMRWRDVADEMGYDERHCRRIYALAQSRISGVAITCPRMSASTCSKL